MVHTLSLEPRVQGVLVLGVLVLGPCTKGMLLQCTAMLYTPALGQKPIAAHIFVPVLVGFHYYFSLLQNWESQTYFFLWPITSLTGLGSVVSTLTAYSQ